MDWHTMRRVMEDVAPAVEHGQVQKVRQPDAYTLCLSIRIPGQSTHLILSAQPEFTRIGMKSQATPNLDTPTGLGMWVRKHAKGRRVGTLTLDQNDRIVTLPVAGGRLVLEVFGTSGLLCAIDDDGILRASAGRLRPELTMGAPYVAPLPPKELTRGSDKPFPGALTLEAEYQLRIAEKIERQNQQAIHRLLKGAEKKLKRLKRKVQADLDRCADAETYRIHGELLKGQLHRVQPGASHVTLDDWFAEGIPERTIPLDARLDGPANVQALFRKYRRGRDGIEKAQTRMELVETRFSSLDELKNEALSIEDLKVRLHALKLWSPQREAGQRSAAPRSPYYVFHSKNGDVIWVGRGAQTTMPPHSNTHAVTTIGYTPRTCPAHMSSYRAVSVDRAHTEKRSWMLPPLPSIIVGFVMRRMWP